MVMELSLVRLIGLLVAAAFAGASTLLVISAIVSGRRLETPQPGHRALSRNYQS